MYIYEITNTHACSNCNVLCCLFMTINMSRYVLPSCLSLAPSKDPNSPLLLPETGMEAPEYMCFI